jgi:hypothetical protein
MDPLPQLSLFALPIDRLRVGDILLTRADTASSISIRMVSGAPELSGLDRWVIEEFSHAAIYAAEGIFVEAVTSGVSRLAIRQTAVRDRDNVRILRLKPQVPDGEAFAARAGALAPEFLYRRYAEFKQFLATLRHDLRDSTRLRLFCSQLVGAAYAEAGLPLFDDVLPEKLTPGRLTRSPLLENVTDRCLQPVLTDKPPAFYLDGRHGPERELHAEVKAFQAVLKGKEVVRALKRLGIRERPATLLALQRILLDTRDERLDEAIRKGLHEHGYREVEPPKMAAQAAALLDDARADAARLSSDMASMSDDALLYWLRDATNTLLQLDADLPERWEQVQGYRTLTERTGLRTFRLLHVLWERRARLIEEGRAITHGEQHLVMTEVRRRGLDRRPPP